MEVSKRIFELLAKKKIEQKEFAFLVGTTDKTVSAWKTGRSKSFMKYLPKIAEVLETTVEYLLHGTQQTSDQLTQHEEELIAAYRKADERTRHIVDLNLEPFGLSVASDEAM